MTDAWIYVGGTAIWMTGSDDFGMNCTGGNCQIAIDPLTNGLGWKIIGTDYTTYAVVYSSATYLGVNVTPVFILTRNTTISATAEANAQSTLSDLGLNLK